MNTQYRGVALIDIDRFTCPNGLEIGFKNEDIEIDMVEDSIRESITAITDYWCSSTAITGGTSYTVQWISPNTIRVMGSFYRGNFQGDLMHRKALTSGDEQFSIGLLKLFFDGYIPKTRRGKGIYRSEAIPLYIKCLYQTYNPPDVLEIQLRVNRIRFNSIVAEMIDTIRKL